MRFARSRNARALAALALLSGATFVSSPAAAYCRTKACDTTPSYGDVWDEAPQPTECVRNAQDCYVQGTPLFWPHNCLSFAVQKDGSKKSEISAETAAGVIAYAFEKWASVDCGGGEAPSFRVKDSGTVDCSKAEYNQIDGNSNTFMFRDKDWPYHNAIDALALTTVTYNVETGEIYDADVEVNTDQATFTTTPMPPTDAADLEAVLTHEIGHFLGLSHSEVNAATMRAIGYQLGTIGLRTLAPDDVQGVCEIYPPGQSLSSSCEPRHGFSKACGVNEESGCAIGGPSSSFAATAGGFFGMLGVGVLIRRARRRGVS